MLDIKAIRQAPDAFKRTLARKGVASELIDSLLAADQTHREHLQTFEALQREQNEGSKRIPTLAGDERAAAVVAMKSLSERIAALKPALQEAEATMQQLLETLPNPPHDSAPDGKDDTENVVVKTWGDKPTFAFQPKEHWELGEALGILDTERSAKVSGARFFYLRNELALLQRALVFWAFTEVGKRGFSPTIPPFMVREEAMAGTGFLTGAGANEIYRVNADEDNLYLIGTSEVPMTSFYADEILDEATLPQKFVAYSPCFRREAGSYGKDTRGLFRVHQFEKVEMVVFCKPEDSVAMHEEILAVEESLLQALNLHYQVVNVCTGDLGGSAAKKYDIEAWLPGQGKYREMTSTSICTDFQARRLRIRLRRADGTVEPLHTLNGTAVSGRPLVAIMEQYQQEDGSILIPSVLQPFMGGRTRIARA
jgi:seryl-tRNA synthetase